MGSWISKTNRGRLDRWTSTTLGCMLAGLIVLLAGAALVSVVWAIIYGIIFLTKGPHVYGSSELTWNTFGNTAQHNHVKRIPSSEHGSPTPRTHKTPEFTITETPVTNAPSPGPTTTSAVVDGQVVTYVFYSPRTWLTLAAIPHRSAIPQTRYSEMRRIVDYSMRSWTEDGYIPVQTMLSFFQTETLSGPVTIGTDGLLGTATGSLKNVRSMSFRTASAATTSRLPECKPENTRMGERQHGRQKTCTYPEHANSTAGLAQAAKGSETTTVDAAMTTEAVSNPALFWIPTGGSLEERDVGVIEETEGAEAIAAIMTKDDNVITMIAGAPETSMESALFWIPTGGLEARDIVTEVVTTTTATPTVTVTSTAVETPIYNIFGDIGPVSSWTERGPATTMGPPSDIPSVIPTGVFEADKVEATEAAVAETSAATEDEALFWVPSRVYEAEKADATEAPAATKTPSEDALFWIPTSGRI